MTEGSPSIPPMPKRTILIGRNRRITLDELHSLSRGEAKLELAVAANDDATNIATATPRGGGSSDAPSSSTTTKYSPSTPSIGGALARLSLVDEDGASSSSLLSEGATIASLSLLALTLSQGRILPPVPLREATIRALIELVNASVERSDDAAIAAFRLPSDASSYASVVNGILSSHDASGTSDDDDASGSRSTIAARLECGPYLARAIDVARASLMLARARSLSSRGVCDAISALTIERLGGHRGLSLDAYSSTKYDELRPHKGCVESASVIRACLQGSTRVLTGGNIDAIDDIANAIVADVRSNDGGGEGEGGKEGGGGIVATRTKEALVDAIALRYAMTIPQYHGPTRDAIMASCKTMEIEMNCSANGPRDVLDETVPCLAIVSTLTGLLALIYGIEARIGGKVVGGDGGPNPPGMTKSPPSPWGLTGMASELEWSVGVLQESLEREARLGCEYVSSELARRESEHRAKEAERAAKRANAEEGRPKDATTNNDKDADEFAGMSEEKKAKILKKRAEKEAKIAAKLKAKEDKASGGQAALSSVFGAGTALIYPLLSPVSSSDGFLSDVALLSELERTVDGLLSGGMQRKPKVPKGTRDYLPEQMSIRDEAFGIIRRVFKRHGAVEIDTPVFELKETLTGKYGEDSKLIYDLADQGGESLALRYDLTVPFARFLAVNAVGNIKRYHIGKVYRRDQPALSRGRYREFYQCDFDIAGSYGRMVPDSECLAVACEILDALPIGDFGIKVNHRRLLDAILDICGVPADKFRSICSAVDKLDKEPWSEVRREMVEEKGLAGDVADRIGEFVVLRGEPWEMYKSLMDGNKFGDHKGALDAMEDLRICFDYLDAMDKLRFISFDLSLARGLDYYTGIIYEAVCMNGNTQVGSIGGGGRYDNLVSMFQEAGKVTPCVGVSVGIERVFTLMEERLRQEQGGSIKQPNVTVLIASAGENLLRERMKLARVLWDANISAEFSQQENPKLKFEIANALDRQIPFMVISGEEEAREGKCKVKDLKARTEETIDLSQLVKTLRGKGVVPVGCEFAMELLNSERE